MKPSDLLIEKFDKLEKDLQSAIRNQGVICCDHAVEKLKKNIDEYKRAINLLSTNRL